MIQYREILRLKSLGFSDRNIAHSCRVSRNTVAKVAKKAAEINLSWPLHFDMTDSVLEELLFPKDRFATKRRMPDFDYIRKELLRNGVNKKTPLGGILCGMPHERRRTTHVFPVLLLHPKG